MPVIDVSNLKVADLKRELKDRGLSIAGNKNELQERLQAAIDGEPLLEDSSIVGEDILDEEEGVLSDEEKILGSDENELLKSPSATPTKLLPKIADSSDAILADDDILESPKIPAKKVVLKRKISSGPTSETSNVTTKENTEPVAEKVAKVCERIPITVDGSSVTPATKKLTQLTMQERLDMRAKKFGISSTAPAKDDNAISQAPVVSSEKQVEILKKRAERFGCVTSTNLAKLDTEEKLLKRKQRFGGEVKNTVTETNSDEWAVKARKRLERFGGGEDATKKTAPEAVTSTTPAAVVTTAAGN